MLHRLLLFVLPILAGCAAQSDSAFRLPEAALAIREMQTREYDGMTDTNILAASAAVLQDLGYTIDEVEEPLGLLSASKRASASNRMDAIGRIALDGVKCIATLGLGCNGSQYGKLDDVQSIRLTLVARPKLANPNDVTVRVTMQREIRDKRGRISARQTISDESVYSRFFEKMSQAVFLERQGA